MFRTVLCAVDRDTSSAVPIEAGELAAGLGCPLVLVHVVQDSGFTDARPGREQVRAIEEERALGLLHRARLELPAMANVRERVAFGPPVGMLVALASDENAEVLVVGSRGLGPLAAALMSSVSRALTRAAPCPVVVVSPAVSRDEPAPPRERDAVVCGVDATELSARTAVFAADMAERLRCRLVLVHACDGDGAAREVARTLASVTDGSPAVRVGEGEPAEALASIARSEGARLLVVGSRGLGSIRAAVSGSVSAAVMRSADCPVAVVPDGVDPAETTRGEQGWASA
jgi:nucleotide-binding universal stress UspA family protein